MNTCNYHARILDITFEHCTLDSGLVHSCEEDTDDIEYLTLTNCTLRGGCHAWAYVVTMQSDTLDDEVSWGRRAIRDRARCERRSERGADPREYCLRQPRLGLRIVSPQDSVYLGCNDWFRNGMGAVTGVAESADDLKLDPLFCDYSAGNVSPFANSPLVGRPGCGQIGAKDVGCAVLVAGRAYWYRVAYWEQGGVAHSAPVSASLAVAGPASRVTPNPSRGIVDVE